MAGRDITEGRSTRAIAVDIGVGTGNIWQNTGIQYDVAIAGIPFLTGINDNNPYQRATAPFRKQQFDSQRDPGEQSLTGWWLRSQSSFHAGEGIQFYDPLANPYSTTIASNSYRIKSTYGVNIWEPGQATLLRDTTEGHLTISTVNPTNRRTRQHIRSVRWNNTDGVLLHDGYDIDRIHADGTVDHWVDNAAGQDPVFSVCDDGQYAYWITNDSTSGKLEFNKKSLAATSGATPTVMFSEPGTVVTNAVVEYVKQRLVLAVNNKIFEFPVTQSTMPTAIYTHPNTSYIFSSIAESGTAIYVSGYNGIQSSIFKFVLDTTSGAMPTLSSAITAAEMPAGERVNKLFYYLGYMCIGTSAGVRIASIGNEGSITYGPLIVETIHGCYDFAARNTYVWCATGIPIANTEPGLIRVDLSNEIETLRFAYGKDLHYNSTEHSETTAVGFIGETDRLAFCTAAGLVDTTVVNKALTSNVVTLTMAGAHGLTPGEKVWVEGVGAPFDSGSPYTGETVLSVPTSTTFTYSRTTSNVTSTVVTSTSAVVKTIGHIYYEHATNLVPSGYIETGYIRYNTLEQKNFKRLVGHGDFTHGSMSLQSVDLDGGIYDINSYDAAIGSPESAITQPVGAQDAIALRFVLYRDADDATVGPAFKGYQLKAVPASPRERIIKIPLLNYDTETDKYNSTIGYEGRAAQRLAALEDAESSGDVVTWQDFRTGEIQQCLIEEVAFVDTTPPDKRLTGFGGIISLTIRTV